MNVLQSHPLPWHVGADGLIWDANNRAVQIICLDKMASFIVNCINERQELLETLGLIATHDGDGMVDYTDKFDAGPSGMLSAAKVARQMLARSHEREIGQRY